MRDNGLDALSSKFFYDPVKMPCSGVTNDVSSGLGPVKRPAAKEA